MRLAHLILVHNNPTQLERLVKRLYSTNSDVYIHIDNKSAFSDFENLSLLPNVFFIKKRISVGWGNFSMVEATLISMQEIIATTIQYSHINLLSGQDYPLKNINQIENYFFENADKSFMNYASINNEWLEAKNRLLKYNLGDLSIPFKYRIQNLMNRYLPDRKIPENLEPYGSSQWFTLTIGCVKYILNYLSVNKKVLNYFKWTWAVDEIIFQTILLNSPFKNEIVNDNKRYIVFIGDEASPKTFQITDADEILKSNKFFARKFSIQIDNTILDYLDNIIN